jgi:small-conductance mechanosensitive channel
MNIKPLTLLQRIKVHGTHTSADDWETLERELAELRAYRAEAAIYGCRTPDELRQKLLQRTSEVAILATTQPTINEALSCEIDSLKEDLIAAREALNPLLQANADLVTAYDKEVEANAALREQIAALTAPPKPSFEQEARAHRLSLGLPPLDFSPAI